MVYRLILILGVSALYAPMLKHSGWPMNHEGPAPFESVEIYRQLFVSGEWFPTWAPDAQWGYGSPMPLLYHHLFFWLAGLIAWLTGSYLALKILAGIVLLLGALGQSWALREMGVRAGFAAAGGLLLAIAPYTWLNWLVRGAFAEFTAAMILPWILGWMEGVRKGRYRWYLGATLFALLYHAHTLIFIFSFFILICFLVFERKKIRLEKHSWGALTVFLVIVAPYGLATKGAMSSFSVERLHQFKPQENFQKLYLLFAHNSFKWGEMWRGVSTEINRYLICGLVVLGILLRKKKIKNVFRDWYFVPAALLIYLIFQTPLSKPFFDHVPGMDYLQFPFRLLTFVMPLMIMVFIRQAEFLSLGNARRFAGFSVLAVTILSLLVPLQALRLKMDWLPLAQLTEKMADPQGTGAGYEYLPRGIEKKMLRPDALLVSAPLCGPVTMLRSGADIELTFNNPKPCEVELRQFATPLLRAQVTHGKRIADSALQTFRFELNTGEAKIKLQSRSVLELAALTVLGR